MRLGLGHGLDVGYRPELFGNLALLELYPGAAAAYSLRNIDGNTATNVVRVRRSSDDAEADFTAAEVSDGTLEAWVNTEYNLFTSDFTSGNNNLNLILNGTGTDGETIAGVSDVFKYVANSATAIHGAIVVSPIDSLSYTVDFDYYIPSSNAAIKSIRLAGNPTESAQYFTVQDSWTSATHTLDFTTSTQIVFLGGNAAGNALVTSGADGDVFYLKNIVVTQTTADGHTVTWYDQSGNGKNFTQATAASQPKLVNAGSLITLNSLPAIESDGTNDFMQTAAGVFGTVTDLYVFKVAAFTGTSLDNDFIFGVSNGSYGGGSHFIALRQFLGNNQIVISTPVDTTENGASNTNQHLFSTIYDGGAPALTLGVDGSDVTESATVPSSITPNQEIDLFVADNSGSKINYGPVKIQELIFYASDKSADRADIETAINSHYSIY